MELRSLILPCLTSLFAFGGVAGSGQTVSTLPVWNYSVVSPIDGNTYSAQIVGRSPLFHGHTSTTIKTYLVPVALKFSDGTVFDPTATDACSSASAVGLVEQSPLFQSTDFAFTDSNGNHPVDIGNTQYIDAFERGSFWKYVAPQTNIVLPQHTLLALITLPLVQVIVPAGDGTANPPLLVGQCAFGSMDYTWFHNYLSKVLLPSLAAQGVGPDSLPIILFRDVVMYPTGGSKQCPPDCYVGDHGITTSSSGALQTYVIGDFDTTGEFDPDIAGLSREIAGWLNDPFGANKTPGWTPLSLEIEPGLSSCATLLEVGAPLAGYQFQVTMPNSFTYDPQELAFPSWFYRQSPSIAEDGRYSDAGTFTSDAGGACQVTTSSGKAPSALAAGH